jgi:hypothetical protein
MNIAGLSKAAVLAALYNASRPQGMGFMHYNPKPMTEPEAQHLLDSGQTYFDYLHGRVMKISLKGDELETHLYDRDNGPGAAEVALQALLTSGSVFAPEIQAAHQIGKLAAIDNAERSMGEQSRIEVGDGVAVHTLTLADVKEQLAPAIEKARQA